MSYDKAILFTDISLRLVKVKLFCTSRRRHYLSLYKLSNYYTDSNMDSDMYSISDISDLLSHNTLNARKNNNVNLFGLLRVRLSANKISLRFKPLNFYNNYEWRLR